MHVCWIRRAIATAVIFGTLGCCLGSLAAQTFTQFPLTPPLRNPVSIVTGSDGALWFTVGDSSQGPGHVVRITPNGAFTNTFTADHGIGKIIAGPDGALWFIAGGTTFAAPGIGRITTQGAVSFFPTPHQVFSIAFGADGNLWFPDPQDVTGGSYHVERMTPDGTITPFAVPTKPAYITGGPDGALWFTGMTDASVIKIARITTDGTYSDFTVPSDNTHPNGATVITTGPDGALWFIDPTPTTNGVDTRPKIQRITTSGVRTSFSVPTVVAFSSNTGSLVAGPDGALWFGEANNGLTQNGKINIGRITTSGVITEFAAIDDTIFDMTAGPDGAMWFLGQLAGVGDPGSIGRITVPASATPLVAAVLPSSRSVKVGNTATAFATIINSGSTAATGCALAPITSVPANFLYQTTNPLTNALIGSPNTPANIAAGALQTFVFALTANAPEAPLDVAIGFACSGLDAAVINSGLNTLLFSSSATPVPDIIALGGTAQNDGTLHIPGASGSAAFVVATINLGSGATITAAPFGPSFAPLPLSLNICQTNPQTGQCISPMGPSVSTAINPNATPTFAIFATATGSVPFQPATNRINVRFTDAGGVVRGSTSVAVATQ
jgi:hypothetical protein